MESIKDIIQDIRNRGLIKCVIRRPVLPYDMDIAKRVLIAVGTQFCAKFAIDEENRWVYEQLIKWVQGDPTMECIDPVTRQKTKGNLNAGLYIAGNTGTGKSVALDVMAAFTLVDNIRITLGDNTRPLKWSSYRSDIICDEYTTTGSIARFKHQPILAVQDLGSEPEESMYMGNRMPVMRSLIEFRGDQTDCMTLFTSNYPMASPKLVKKYGERAISRLQQMCNYFELRGTDRRKK